MSVSVSLGYPYEGIPRAPFSGLVLIQGRFRVDPLEIHGCFCILGLVFVSIFVVRALLLEVYIRAPDFLETPIYATNTLEQAVGMFYSFRTQYLKSSPYTLLPLHKEHNVSNSVLTHGINT